MSPLLFKSQFFANIITFGMLMDRHLETLRAVREKEKAIPPNLMKDWLKIQKLSSQFTKWNRYSIMDNLNCFFRI